MYLLTEFGRAGRENIWHEVMAYGLSTARSVLQIFSRPNSVNKYFIMIAVHRAFPFFFSSFFFFFFFGKSHSECSLNYVAHFDRKVAIYLATKF